MSTFNQMAEEWIRANLPPAEGPQVDYLADLRGPFVRWVDLHCIIRPRWFSNINPLLLDFAEMEIAADRVPPTHDEFVKLINEIGALVGEVDGTVLVNGIALRRDVEAFEAAEYKHQSAAKPDASNERVMRATAKDRTR